MPKIHSRARSAGSTQNQPAKKRTFFSKSTILLGTKWIWALLGTSGPQGLGTRRARQTRALFGSEITLVREVLVLPTPSQQKKSHLLKKHLPFWNKIEIGVARIPEFQNPRIHSSAAQQPRATPPLRSSKKIAKEHCFAQKSLLREKHTLILPTPR